MTSRDFVFWLQGYLEVSAAESGPGLSPTLTRQQMTCVRQHLALVFKHEIDPSMGPAEHQAELNKVHGHGPVVGKPKSHGPLRC